METVIIILDPPTSLAVLILPMRNGNPIILHVPIQLALVLILPMRNGNCTFVKYHLQKFLFVLILPMRNGNERNIEEEVEEKEDSSYPTYEEWKLN